MTAAAAKGTRSAMVWFALYSLLFIGLAFSEYRRGQTREDFFLNSRRSKTHQVGFSIVASCVGGSAVIGMSGLAFSVGMPALWWLLSSACGLLILRVFLVSRIRASSCALTMPEMIRGLIGEPARRMSSVIILCAWIAILAAQFAAMGRIVEGVSGLSSGAALVSGAFVIVLYTWLGGQASVIKSDVIQFAAMALGLVFLLAALVLMNPEPLRAAPVEWLNEAFTISDWTRFLLLVGGSYVVCPMLFTRIMSAGSDKAAARGVDIALAGLVAAAFVITGIGIEARAFVPENVPGDAVLTHLIGQLAPWAGAAFFFVMASAVLSSADSCLITAATVAANDVCGKPTVAASRRLVLLLSAAALALAFSGKSVLGLLLAANTIYTCAVVVPIFLALALNRPLASKPAVATIACAGALALASELLELEWLSYAAMLVSLAGSLAALRCAMSNPGVTKT